MENLKAKSFDLRKDTVDIIVAGKGGHIGGDMSVIDTLMSLYFCQMNISRKTWMIRIATVSYSAKVIL